MIPSTPTRKLEDLGHDELLQTTRRLLAEADSLSSRIAAVNEIGLAVQDEVINRLVDLLLIKPVSLKQITDFATRLTQTSST